MYNLDFHENIYEDLLVLPDEVIKEAEYYFNQLEIDPYSCSSKLYGNLKDCRKVYMFKATYRIIIKIINNKIKIVNIVAVGKREDKEVYNEAYKRVDSFR